MGGQPIAFDFLQQSQEQKDRWDAERAREQREREEKAARMREEAAEIRAREMSELEALEAEVHPLLQKIERYKALRRRYA